MLAERDERFLRRIRKRWKFQVAFGVALLLVAVLYFAWGYYALLLNPERGERSLDPIGRFAQSFRYGPKEFSAWFKPQTERENICIAYFDGLQKIAAMGLTLLLRMWVLLTCGAIVGAGIGDALIKRRFLRIVDVLKAGQPANKRHPSS